LIGHNSLKTTLMFDNRSTYEISAKQIADYVQPLSLGANALPFELRDEFGRMLSLNEDYLSGKHLVLIFLNSTNQQLNTDTLRQVANAQEKLHDNNITVIAITARYDDRENFHVKHESGFVWPVTNDPGGSVFAAFGLHKLHGEPIRLILLTPQRQVRAWFDSPADIEATLKDITAMTTSLAAFEDARWSACHAPVLHVPNVFSPEECGRLIAQFNQEDQYLVRPPREGEVTRNFKVPVYEHNRQDRVDQIVKDPKALEFIDQRIFGRITPMIMKAFAFNVTRREAIHVARYTGAREGQHMGHRDNTSAAMSYRRFALSIALNNDFEGGEITFEEYSPHGYKPFPGTALVFSSSLLHEVSEITRGTRYSLISNLFNDETLRR